MPFIEVPGVNGKVYVPEPAGESPKKHPCKDCYQCQMCGESRCRVCRGEKKARECHAPPIREKCIRAARVSRDDEASGD